MAGRSVPPGGSPPSSLSELLQRAGDRLRLPEARRPTDGILFAGNRQEAVPRALFTDLRLTPLERNAWQVLRILIEGDGVISMPTYDQLRPYLSSVPCGGVASDETLARAFTLLRLSRWLTLVSRQRDPSNGRNRGNLYVLHDGPLSPSEVIQLDSEYMSLVSVSLSHASKAIQRLGHHTLREIVDDPLLVGALPSRLHIIATQLASQSWALPPSTPPSDSDEAGPPSESEGGLTAGESRLRNPKAASTVRTLDMKEVRTVQREREDPPRLRYPEFFGRLKPEQQSAALEALRRVAPELQQAVLDDWSMRCRESTVRNPAGYLFGTIQAALRGDFNLYAGRPRRPADRNRS